MSLAPRFLQLVPSSDVTRGQNLGELYSVETFSREKNSLYHPLLLAVLFFPPQTPRFSLKTILIHPTFKIHFKLKFECWDNRIVTCSCRNNTERSHVPSTSFPQRYRLVKLVVPLSHGHPLSSYSGFFSFAYRVDDCTTRVWTAWVHLHAVVNTKVWHNLLLVEPEDAESEKYPGAMDKETSYELEVNFKLCGRSASLTPIPNSPFSSFNYISY